MTKYKVTRKAMKESYDKIICVSYCNLQNLLRFQEPFAYSKRTESWACGYYNIDSILISTSYAPIDSRRTKSNYDICRKYDEAARKVLCECSSYEEQKEIKLRHMYYLGVQIKIMEKESELIKF